MLFARDVLAIFPTAALGALVIYAATRLIGPAESLRLARFRLSELILALVTTVTVLGLGVLYGVLVAVALSILDLLRRVAHAHDFTTGAMRVEPDRRHVRLPVIGTVRVHENTRRIERLIRAGPARVLAISVRRNGTRLDASVRVLVQRPQQPHVARPDSRVGVDVGVRRLATVATAAGSVIERVENPRRPLDTALRELRHVSRARARGAKGCRRYRERTTELYRLHRRVKDVRTHHLHVLTARLAKTHGRIVVEGCRPPPRPSTPEATRKSSEHRITNRSLSALWDNHCRVDDQIVQRPVQVNGVHPWTHSPSSLITAGLHCSWGETCWCAGAIAYSRWLPSWRSFW